MLFHLMSSPPPLPVFLFMEKVASPWVEDSVKASLKELLSRHIDEGGKMASVNVRRPTVSICVLCRFSTGFGRRYRCVVIGVRTNQISKRQCCELLYGEASIVIAWKHGRRIFQEIFRNIRLQET